MACSFYVSVSQNTCTITLSGLAENMQPSLELLMELGLDAQPDMGVYKSLITNVLKNRIDAKADQRTCFQRLQMYAQYGPENPSTLIISEKDLLETDPATLIDKIHDLISYGVEVYYYGPESIEKAGEIFTSVYPVRETPRESPEKKYFIPQVTLDNKIYLAQYDANQLYYASYSAREGETFDNVPYTLARMYNEYFGSSMNAVVFQEMREARGLAYSASARYGEPARIQEDFPYVFTSFIATQNDKMREAMDAFHDIINEMPESEKSFELAKEGLISTLRTDRIMGRSLLNYYRQAKDKGLWEDMRREVFNHVQPIELQDIVDFQKEWIANRPTVYTILSDIKALDLDYLSGYGEVIKLDLKDIFGY